MYVFNSISRVFFGVTRRIFNSEARLNESTAFRAAFKSPSKGTVISKRDSSIDAINARYGKGKVFSASEGIGDKSWKMKRSKLSKRASTRWDELITVR